MIIRKSMEKYIFLFFQESKGRWQFLNQKIYKFRQANFAIDQSRSKGKENFTLIQFITGEFLSSPCVLPKGVLPSPPFFSPFSLLLACVSATWLRHKARLERGKRIYEGVFTGVTSRSRGAPLRQMETLRFTFWKWPRHGLRGFVVNLFPVYSISFSLFRNTRVEISITFFNR